MTQIDCKECRQIKELKHSFGRGHSQGYNQEYHFRLPVINDWRQRRISAIGPNSDTGNNYRGYSSRTSNKKRQTTKSTQQNNRWLRRLISRYNSRSRHWQWIEQTIEDKDQGAGKFNKWTEFSCWTLSEDTAQYQEIAREHLEDIEASCCPKDQSHCFIHWSRNSQTLYHKSKSLWAWQSVK